MSLGGPGPDADAVVAALRAVAGVADAEILPDGLGGPGTLRLQLDPGADEVRVATTVHRLLGDRFGLGVDAGRVQVVEEAMTRRQGRAPDFSQAASREPADEFVGRHSPRPAEPVAPIVAEPLVIPEPAANPIVIPEVLIDAEPLAAETPHEPSTARLMIHRMQLVSARSGVSSEVSLEHDGAIHNGAAEALSTTKSVHRAVAQATLRAVEEAVGPSVRFELEHLETMPLGSEYAVIVEIAMVTRVGTERLTGVSAVREDARQAVIRATLDALNRRIETYLLSL